MRRLAAAIGSVAFATQSGVTYWIQAGGFDASFGALVVVAH
jgi:hypothetical protein